MIHDLNNILTLSQLRGSVELDSQSDGRSGFSLALTISGPADTTAARFPLLSTDLLVRRRLVVQFCEKMRVCSFSYIKNKKYFFIKMMCN